MGRGGGDEVGVEGDGSVGADQKGVDFEALVGGPHLALAGGQPECRVHFQFVYHLWVNVIERLWKTLHDTVTQNHRNPSI